jgi:hypothetical protein
MVGTKTKHFFVQWFNLPCCAVHFCMAGIKTTTISIHQGIKAKIEEKNANMKTSQQTLITAPFYEPSCCVLRGFYVNLGVSVYVLFLRNIA